jgi:hypothetical protein
VQQLAALRLIDISSLQPRPQQNPAGLIGQVIANLELIARLLCWTATPVSFATAMGARFISQFVDFGAQSLAKILPIVR